MSGKENAPVALQQSVLSLPMDNGKSDSTLAPRGGKKRTLTVKAELAVNLNDTNIPVTKEVVEAMRKRILELEEALDSQSSAKRPRLSKNVEEAPKAGSSSSTTLAPLKSKVDSKKLDAILKKFWSSLQKELKTEKYKFRGGPPKSCKIEEIIEPEEFNMLFIDKLLGVVVQPTPSNKPNSTVTIIQYDADEVEGLFGKHFKELKGNRYSIGGWGARFAKGEKIGLVALRIGGLEISYAKNTMKCSLKIEVEEKNEYRLCLDEEVYYGW